MLKVPCQRYSENDAKMRNFITLHLLGLFCCEKVLEREKKESGERTRQQKQTEEGEKKVLRMLEAQGRVCFGAVWWHLWQEGTAGSDSTRGTRGQGMAGLPFAQHSN